MQRVAGVKKRISFEASSRIRMHRFPCASHPMNEAGSGSPCWCNGPSFACQVRKLSSDQRRVARRAEQYARGRILRHLIALQKRTGGGGSGIESSCVQRISQVDVHHIGRAMVISLPEALISMPGAPST